ncbi:50S ribosomal protein L4 [Micrococcales bacterium 31B]|nr:50S ribosomal protein L4 [Micrococcales bacterium 31B]
MTSATLTVDVLDTAGKKAGSAELPATVFDVQTNVPLIHQVVVAQLAAARQGTHKAKTRAEVRGGGKKPYKQKGTGNARQGSTRAPQYAGGGTVHGPVPRDYSQRTPKKMIAAAIRGVLSDRARAGRVHVVTEFVLGDKPSTKSAVATLRNLTDREKFLLVIDRTEEIAALSTRNISFAHVLFADQLNAYDVVTSDDVVFSKAALEFVVAGAPERRAASEPVAAVSAPAAVAPTAPAAAAEEGPYGPDSAAPLADGSAPDGFTIKGNAQSQKYHTTSSRWYESTVAEVWFRTEEAAVAAGFVAPGAKAAESKEASK